MLRRLVALAALVPRLAHAQGSPLAYATTERPLPIVETSKTVAILRTPITIDFDDVTLEDALQRITQKAGLGLTYGEHYKALSQRVALHARDVSVTEALTAVLNGTGLDLLAWPSGNLLLVAHGARVVAGPVEQGGTGVITGHVTDVALKTPLSDVAVRVEGTTLSATANGDGKYTITGVASGTYHVTARRVGYQLLMKDVTVSADQQATLDFALTAAPTRLDEVVTTAVGQRRRYEVGNDIATINADSIVPTAPITSMTDLISARAPGVEVIETGGLTGSGEAIRIRGQSSLLLQGDPIIIVDGIREDNTAGGMTGNMTIFAGVPSPSRINDFDPSEIESIDVLKGPAASTEYGTDAASGVIVITTKRGTAGRPQWHASAEQTASDIPVTYPDAYYSWGHTLGGTPSAIECPLVAGSGQPSATTNTCAVDSVTHFNPLNHPFYSLYGTGERAKYDLSVGGGSDAVRYYVTGGLSNEIGIAHMPDVFRDEIVASGFPSSILKPNDEDQRSGRATSTIRLGSNADLSVTAAYLSTFSQLPSGAPAAGLTAAGPNLPDSADNYGYGVAAANNPLTQLGGLSDQQTSRTTAGLTGSWRPMTWLETHGTVGIDHGSQQISGTLLPQSVFNSNGSLDNGALSESQITTDIYSADVRATATAALTRTLRAVTSVGAQLADTRTQGLLNFTNGGVPATNLTLDGIPNVSVLQTGQRSATLGAYGEEELGLADRLFVTGAVRVDAASGFGHSYASATYPKGSVSWLAIEHGPTTLRLRAAVGESGRQPYDGDALELASPTVDFINGQEVSGYTPGAPGNQHLRPERSEEYEGGFDVGLWNSRLSVEGTAYQKLTHDALYDINLGWDLSYSPYEVNLGEVKNEGLEGTVTGVVIQSRPVVWTMTLNASVNSDRLVHLGPSALPFAASFYNQRQVPGYPLYGYWGLEEHYADANHDGIIEANELTLADSASYMGSSIPTQEASLATNLELFHGTIGLAGLVDYRGGYKVYNAYAEDAAFDYKLREQAIRTAPLWLQARAVGALYDQTQWAPSGFFEDGSFVRFRELSLTYVLVTSLARRLRVGTLSLTGAVRNLALWTRFTGPDPEVSGTGSGALQFNVNGTQTINNDIRASTEAAVPLARYFVLRLNVGL